MSKYLKLLLLAGFALSFNISNAQETESSETDEKSQEEEEEEETTKTITTPNLLPTAELSGVESNDIVKFLRNPNRGTLSLAASAVISASNVSASARNAIGSSGVDSAEIILLGTSNLEALSKILSGSSALKASQFKTLVDVVDVFSNVEESNRDAGRRAISTEGVDIASIVNSTVNTVTIDHLDTLSNLDTTHMKTFAGDGISNIDNFTTRVDVTSAMVGNSLGGLSSENLGLLVEHLHSSLDADSLTALKSLDKSHMSTLVGSGDKKIDLTSSFDPSALKKSVKKFATKAEITVTFAKKAGGVNFEGVDLSVIALQIHTNLDDDHLDALQNLSMEHMNDMMPDASSLKSGLDVTHIAHVATKAEVVIQFAKASAGNTKLNDDGTLDFGTSFTATNMKAFVTTVHTHISEDMTKSLALFDPEHMGTLVPSGGTMDQSELEHFGGKAQVGATFFTSDMTEEQRKAKALEVASKMNALDKDMTTAFKTLTDHSPDIDFSDIVGNISLDKIHHAGAKAKATSTFVAKGSSVEDIKKMASDLEADTDHLDTLAVMDQTKLSDSLKTVDIGDALSDKNKHFIDGAHDGTIDPTTATPGDFTADALKTLFDSSDEDKNKIANGDLSLDDHFTNVENDSTNSDSGSGTDSTNSDSGTVITKVWSNDTDINTAATDVVVDAVAKANSYTTTGFPTALGAAVAIAEQLLTERTVTNNTDLGAKIGVSNLTSGYNFELIRLMVKYGAIGKSGSTLADSVLGSDYTSFNSSVNLNTRVLGSTKDYLGFLTYLGSVVSVGNDSKKNTDAGSATRSFSHFNNSIYSVPTENISLNSGSTIVFNDSAEIDASWSPSGRTRRIGIIGAAKDLTIKGNLTIKNTHKAESGALVLGAADDLYFRSEYSTANSADYSTPDVVSITNEGANLALGSEDTMRLVNVSISTGGNLAIGTLNELHIGTTTGKKESATLSIGNNPSSDPDNLYLYAHHKIQIDDLIITGRVDDVYMEAITVNLRGVRFPEHSEVTLRSRDGTINFDSFTNPTVGAVNMQGVRHGSTLLGEVGLGTFTGSAGKWATNKVLPNGTPAVQVKKF